MSRKRAKNQINGTIQVNKSHIEYTSGPVSYTYEITGRNGLDRGISLQSYTNITPDRQFTFVQGFKVISNGDDNMQPVRIANLIETNGMVAGLIKAQIELTYGSGPHLYRTTTDGNTVNREWAKHPGIESFLRDIDHKNLLLQSLTEYAGSERIFSYMQRNVGVRRGYAPKIAGIQVIPETDCRFEFQEIYGNPPKNIIVGDFLQPWQSGLNPYPVWDRRNPFANPVAVHTTHLPSFGRKHNFRPTFLSAEAWHRLDSHTPIILEYYTHNAMLPDFHIQSPANFWEKFRKEFEEGCKKKNVPFTEDNYLKAEEEIFHRVAGTLVGMKNAGKFIHTKYKWGRLGELEDWKVIPIEKNIEKFVKSIIEIHKAAMFVSTNVFAIPTGLSNISTEGNLSSGSEILYSLSLYNATKTAIPELITCAAINEAIQANFPGTDLELGYYRQTVKNESQTSPKDRMLNNA